MHVSAHHAQKRLLVKFETREALVYKATLRNPVGFRDMLQRRKEQAIKRFEKVACSESDELRQRRTCSVLRIHSFRKASKNPFVGICELQ
jgi:hypothetical protein